jgi:predicted nuclease of predicted toxin-antitoxin system
MTIQVLCDVHIARKVVRYFDQKGCKAVHVNDILDSWYTKDADISDYANQHGFTVITKDVDFKHSHILKRQPSRLLKIDLGNISTQRLLDRLDAHYDDIVNAFQAPVCMVELGSNYLRVTLPGGD